MVSASLKAGCGSRSRKEAKQRRLGARANRRATSIKKGVENAVEHVYTTVASSRYVRRRSSW